MFYIINIYENVIKINSIIIFDDIHLLFYFDFCNILKINHYFVKNEVYILLAVTRNNIKRRRN